MARSDTITAIVKKFVESDERLLILPFDGVRENVSQHWHQFLTRNKWDVLKKTFVLALTKHMPSGALKNALLRSIGVKIGKDVFIAAAVVLDPQTPELITIEDGAIIGAHSQIFTHEVTHTHIRLGKVTIGKNALVGAMATVRSGVSIGENGVVALRAFVTEDVPYQTLITGEPERLVKNLSRVL